MTVIPFFPFNTLQAENIGDHTFPVLSAWVPIHRIALAFAERAKKARTGRFNVLRATLGHISSKTLSSRLKLLEELGFVQRLAFLEIPPRVEYHLTANGRELGEVIAALEQFGNKHLSNPVVSTTCADCSSGAEENVESRYQQEHL